MVAHKHSKLDTEQLSGNAEAVDKTLDDEEAVYRKPSPKRTIMVTAKWMLRGRLKPKSYNIDDE